MKLGKGREGMRGNEEVCVWGGAVRANELPARRRPTPGQKQPPGGGPQTAEVGVVPASELLSSPRAPAHLLRIAHFMQHPQRRQIR